MTDGVPDGMVTGLSFKMAPIYSKTYAQAYYAYLPAGTTSVLIGLRTTSPLASARVNVDPVLQKTWRIFNPYFEAPLRSGPSF